MKRLDFLKTIGSFFALPVLGFVPKKEENEIATLFEKLAEAQPSTLTLAADSHSQMKELISQCHHVLFVYDKDGLVHVFGEEEVLETHSKVTGIPEGAYDFTFSEFPEDKLGYIPFASYNFESSTL